MGRPLTGIDGHLRELRPQVLAAVVRRFGHFDLAEDAVQEASLAAATQWPRQGTPDDPRAWLITVTARRLTDRSRTDDARRLREDAVAARVPDRERVGAAADEYAPAVDDTLTLLWLCCHPALPPVSQVALTLRAVGGLSTAEIARAFLVPEATMAQRISRAKKVVGDPSGLAPEPESGTGQRLAAVLHVLYLVFTEGHTATGGADLVRADMTGEAIRLAREVHRARPGNGEVTGLLALMLLTEARRPARVGADGALVPLGEQDRTRWDSALLAEGLGLLAHALATSATGPFQLQAAIAAVHAEAPRAADTDWPQIRGLYRLLETVAPGPMVTLNHAVAAAMADGPRSGRAVLGPLLDDARTAHHHRVLAVRGHLLRMAGDGPGAAAAFAEAATGTANAVERAHLERLAAGGSPMSPVIAEGVSEEAWDPAPEAAPPPPASPPAR